MGDVVSWPPGLPQERRRKILFHLCRHELGAAVAPRDCPLVATSATKALGRVGPAVVRSPPPLPFAGSEDEAATACFDPASWDYLVAVAHCRASPFFRCLESPLEATSVIDGRPTVMLGANNYLGLTTHPGVVERTLAAVLRYGTGCTGSRLMNGTLPLHLELERRLARFFGREAALVFSAGFLANLGVLSTLGTRGTYFLSDHQNHASITEGTLASFARTVRFRHNDPAALRARLRELPAGAPKWVIVEGVHSMIGDVCPLPEILAEAHEAGAWVILDDAHGVGVLGNGGRGTASHFGLDREVDVVVGTFSKSFASYGGFVVADAETVEELRYRARAFVFTAALPPANAATVLAALDVLEEAPALVDRLRRNSADMSRRLIAAGLVERPSPTAIIPLLIGPNDLTWRAWRELFDAGFYTNAVFPPGVPPGGAMLRVSMMATHSPEDVAAAADAIIHTFRRLGVNR